MNAAIAFQHIDWSEVAREEHPGSQGTSHWRTLNMGGLRLRIVEYSPDYLADHWCAKGHIVHCLEGEFESEEESTQIITLLKKGDTYIVSDGMSSHRSRSVSGATLLIIDGNFLST